MPQQPLVVLFDPTGLASAPAQGAPATSRPAQTLATPQAGVLGLGSDYGSTAKAQVPKVDASGLQYVVAQTPAGTSANYQAQQAVAALASVYGPVVMGMQGLTPLPFQLDALQNLVVTDDQLPTFSVVATGVAYATGKSLLALVNASTTGSVVRLLAVYQQNVSQQTGALGYSYNEVAFELRPITGVSATGTSLTALAYDRADTLDTGIKVYTGATVTGDTLGPLRRWVSSDYGATAAGAQQETIAADQQGRDPWVMPVGPNAKPITVRPGYGVHLKAATTATVGGCDATFIFTVAPA